MTSNVYIDQGDDRYIERYQSSRDAKARCDFLNPPIHGLFVATLITLERVDELLADLAPYLT